MSLMILKSKIFQRKTASAMNHLEFQVENNTIRRFVNPSSEKAGLIINQKLELYQTYQMFEKNINVILEAIKIDLLR